MSVLHGQSEEIQTFVRETRTEGKTGMAKGSSYYVIKEKAVPEVLLNVVKAKSLLETGKAHSVAEAAEQTGISRSSFYKYKDDIFVFHDNTEGKTLTFTCEMEDEPGLLSLLLNIIAKYGANVLTIHQSIPINNMASLSISLQILPSTKDVSSMVEDMEAIDGVHSIKIVARE
jgi:chorismate mutase